MPKPASGTCCRLGARLKYVWSLCGGAVPSACLNLDTPAPNECVGDRLLPPPAPLPSPPAALALLAVLAVDAPRARPDGGGGGGRDAFFFGLAPGGGGG